MKYLIKIRKAVANNFLCNLTILNKNSKKYINNLKTFNLLPAIKILLLEGTWSALFEGKQIKFYLKDNR